MAITVTYEDTRLPERISRNLGIVLGSVAYDDDYSTGGDSFDPSGYFGNVLFVAVEPFAGYVFTYDYTSALLLAYYYDYDAGADSAAIEVADTTDLSAITAAKFIVIGTIDT